MEEPIGQTRLPVASVLRACVTIRHCISERAYVARESVSRRMRGRGTDRRTAFTAGRVGSLYYTNRKLSDLASQAWRGDLSRC